MRQVGIEIDINPENAGKKEEIRDKKGRYLKGKSGNLKGKPLGAKNKFSFVGYWQERWAKNPKEFEALATAFMKDDNLRSLIIQLVDGRPSQTIGGDPNNPLVIEISETIAQKNETQ